MKCGVELEAAQIMRILLDSWQDCHLEGMYVGS